MHDFCNYLAHQLERLADIEADRLEELDGDEDFTPGQEEVVSQRIDDLRAFAGNVCDLEHEEIEEAQEVKEADPIEFERAVSHVAGLLGDFYDVDNVNEFLKLVCEETKRKSAVLAA